MARHVAKSKIVVCGILPLFCASCAQQGANKYTFNFASYRTSQAVPYSIYFEKSYFDAPASLYQTSLATASACLALAGFASGTNYALCDTNAKNLFKTLGFTDYYANEWGNQIPTTHSFGVYMAKKGLSDGTTLIGITVRGAGYLSEWASNVTIGENEEFAAGFDEASNLYIQALNTYINEKSIQGKIKIWTAGYSRGGAGVNLAIGKMDDALLQGDSLLPDSIEPYTKDDLYAYCFEAPAGVTFDSNSELIQRKGKDYTNIHCLINLNDPVPFVAPYEFGFCRYGIDHYLPDYVSDFNAKKHIDKVKSILGNLPNSSIVGEYQIDKFAIGGGKKSKYNWTQGRFLSDFIHELAIAMGGRSGYATKLQAYIAEIFTLIYNKPSAKDSLIDLAINIGKKILTLDPEETLLTDLMVNRGKFLTDLEPILEQAVLGSNMEDIDLLSLFNVLKSAAFVLVDLAVSSKGLECIPTLVNTANLPCLGSAHYPELLLSHMTALDPYYQGTSGVADVSDCYWKIVITGNQFDLRANNNQIAKLEADGDFTTNVVAEKTSTGITLYVPAYNDYTIITDDQNLKASLYAMAGQYTGPHLLKNHEADGSRKIELNPNA